MTKIEVKCENIVYLKRFWLSGGNKFSDIGRLGSTAEIY